MRSNITRKLQINTLYYNRNVRSLASMRLIWKPADHVPLGLTVTPYAISKPTVSDLKYLLNFITCLFKQHASHPSLIE